MGKIKRSQIFKIIRLFTLKKAFAAGYVFLFIIFVFYHYYFANKVVYKVSIEGVNVSFKKISDLPDFIGQNFKELEYVDVKIDDNNTFTAFSEELGFKYLPVDTAKKAYNVGRENVLLLGLPSKIEAITKGVDVKLEYEINEDKLNEFVDQIAKEVDVDLKEPSYTLQKDKLSVTKGIDGKALDKDGLKKMLTESFVSKNSEVSLQTREIKAQISEEDLEKTQEKMQEYVASEHYFSYEDRRWVVPKDEVTKLIVPKKKEGSVNFEINKDLLTEKIKWIKQELDRGPRGQVLEVKDGKAVEFVGSLDGLNVNLDKTYKLASLDLIENKDKLTLDVEVTKAPSTKNDYGIEDLIAVGKSRFKGSIVNRIHNIDLSSSKIDGALIAPGEVFSFLKTVGNINKDEGYKSAYVISQGRTILGDGGGVCQVSTTLFRAALNAGLPITARSPHAYRVGYYEQDSGPGLDATVFSPSVDLRFRNDYDGYLLITREFSAKDQTLAFKIYGKKDSREVEVSKPAILSKIAPPPTIYEEDPSLPKGKKVQLEYAALGGSVSFSRTVKKDGNELKDTFKSNYRAWPNVFKIGTGE